MVFEITYRSDEPVSKSRLSVCPPIVTGQRYSESYWVGFAATVPSLFAAAAVMLAGASLPNLAYVAARAAGPDLMKAFATVCSTVKATPRGSMGEALVATIKAKKALSCTVDSMLKVI